MSSNIQIQRICQYCGKEFTARTTVTKCCSDHCSKMYYKAKKRAEKMEQSNRETVTIKSKPIEELQNREFLTVTQVSKLIGCSRQNVYKLINSGKLKATNILEKKTIVTRADLDQLFSGKADREPVKNWKIEDCYNLTEIKEKFGISESLIQNIIQRNNIPKIRNGKFALVPKRLIDEIFNKQTK